MAEQIWHYESTKPGPKLCISTGVHGNERSPIEAGQLLRGELDAGDLALHTGELLLMVANPKAARSDQRWSDGGVDLNRCFHPSVMERAPKLYEEQRAHEIVDHLNAFGAEILVDFHCTVEPGKRFLMQHPSVGDQRSLVVVRWLRAAVLLTDPDLNFGGVSLDEWMSTRRRVGICYETGWIQDPGNTAANVHAEMKNLLAGLEMISGPAREFGGKRLLELRDAQRCEGEGFQWTDGIGENLQRIAAGTVLGRYASGRELVADQDCTLVFPKKRAELLQPGKPMVYFAVETDSPAL